MHADHDFQIGSNHAVCQDYAMSGVKGNLAFAILCDGCSASPDVDFGARVLAHAARDVLEDARINALPYDSFAKKTVRRADLVSTIFRQLDPKFLDSTLLIAWVDQGKLTAMVFGDGMFFHKTANSTRAIHVEFKIPMDGVDRAAPDYPSYHLEDFRKNDYQGLGGQKIIEDCLISKDGFSSTVQLRKPFDPVIIQAPAMPGDVISLCSDGINSFHHANDESISWKDLVDSYVGFKSYPGVFVKRMFNGIRRKCQKEGLYHTDDISLASIVV